MLIHGTIYTAAGEKVVTLSFTPATGAWRVLAPGPVPKTLEGHDSAVWTGSEMLVLGLTSAAYNPATGTWRRIPFHPAAAIGAVQAWTGRQAIFWGGGCCGGSTADGAAYNPAANSWQPLPASPLSARIRVSGAWTGREVIMAGGLRLGSGSDAPPRTFADAAAYNPVTRTWRSLPPMPEARSGATALWDGTEILFIGGVLPRGTGPDAGAVAFNPSTGTWRRLPRMESGRAGFAAVWTGSRVLLWGGYSGTFGTSVIPPHGLAYDPAVNRWSALPTAPLRGRDQPTAVWTGSQMIVWGGLSIGTPTSTAFTDGAAYRPAGP